MIAVDTNILVYAHRPEYGQHAAARARLAELGGGRDWWGIPLHCLVEFSGIVSNPKVFGTPSSADEIADQVAAWLESPSSTVFGEGEDWWPVFVECMRSSRSAGGAVHDARIAACCRYNRVRTLWTADRDFQRFPWLQTFNPLVG